MYIFLYIFLYVCIYLCMYVCIYLCMYVSNRLVKEVVLGEMEGKTKRGRIRSEWLGNVKEWCNEETYILKTQDINAWKSSERCIEEQQFHQSAQNWNLRKKE